MLYIGIDLGNIRGEASLMDGGGQIRKMFRKSIPFIFRIGAGRNRSLRDWFSGTMNGLKELLTDCEKEQVAGISFGGQMHGLQ